MIGVELVENKVGTLHNIMLLLFQGLAIVEFPPLPYSIALA